VGRPGLDPGTLGLKGTGNLFCCVVQVDDVVDMLEIMLLLVGFVCLNSCGVWDEIWDARGMRISRQPSLDSDPRTASVLGIKTFSSPKCPPLQHAGLIGAVSLVAGEVVTGAPECNPIGVGAEWSTSQSDG
jgi:hypothetical protein